MDQENQKYLINNDDMNEEQKMFSTLQSQTPARRRDTKDSDSEVDSYQTMSQQDNELRQTLRVGEPTSPVNLNKLRKKIKSQNKQKRRKSKKRQRVDSEGKPIEFVMKDISHLQLDSTECLEDEFTERHQTQAEMRERERASGKSFDFREELYDTAIQMVKTDLFPLFQPCVQRKDKIKSNLDYYLSKTYLGRVACENPETKERFDKITQFWTFNQTAIRDILMTQQIPPLNIDQEEYLIVEELKK